MTTESTVSLATVARGMWARAGLTLGSAVLIAVAIGSAALGPAYESSASQSFLVTRLQQESPVASGVSVTFTPSGRAAADPAAAYKQAAEVGDPELAQYFGPTSLSLESQHDTIDNVFGFPYEGYAMMRSKPGACQHLEVTGRCPSRTGDVIMLAVDAASVHIKVGDSFSFTGYPGKLHLVGLYRVPNDAASFWFDDSRLATSPPAQTVNGLSFTPAPFLTRASTIAALGAGGWKVDIDRSLLTPRDITPEQVRRARAAVVSLQQQLRSEPGGTFLVSRDNALNFVIDDIDHNRDTARNTVTPAIVSLVLVALALQVRLLEAAADQRRSELALGSLRGMSGRQRWTFGLAEPLTLLVIATPIGVLLGYAAAVGLARIWLIDGVAVRLGFWSVLAVLLVCGAAVLASVLTVGRALREPLSSQLAGVRRPGRSGRWTLIFKLALVLATVVVVVASAAAKTRSDPKPSDLILPLLLAGASGLTMTAATVSVARWWSRLTARHRGVTGFVAARAVSRRREGSLVILPLTAALAISVFAAGVFTAASTWRASTAATRVGADVSYRSPDTLAQTVAATHRIDPAGRWLMAAGVIIQGAFGEKLVLDTPRLARVGVWPGTWTPGIDAAGVAGLLGPQGPGVRLRGSTFSMTLDNQVSSASTTLSISIQVQTATGSTQTMFFEPFQPGSTSTRSVSAAYCRDGCQVQTLLIGGPATTATTLSGTASITQFEEDGRPVAAIANAGDWRPVISPLGLTAGSTRVADAGSGLSLAVDTHGESGIGGASPNDVPAYRPVLMGRSQDTEIAKALGDRLVVKTDAAEGLAVKPVGETDSMPFLGPRGLLIDYTMITRDQEIPDDATQVYVLARGDTPAGVIAALQSLGLSNRTELTATKHLLDQDAYALSLNLYLVAALAAVILALAGLAVNMAVQLPDRRRDAASLRVVGVRRRQIMRAVFTEICAVLGAAGLAGILSGSAAQYLVVRTLTLGLTSSIRTPRVVPTLDVSRMGLLVVTVLVVMVAVATVVASLAVRRGRASILRESGR